MVKIKYQLVALTLTLAILLVGMTSCVPGVQTQAPESTPEHAAPPKNYPDIQGIAARIAVEDGETTSDVNFYVNTSGAFLELANWSGDIILYLDAEPPTAPNESAIPTTGMYRQGLENLTTWTNLAPGEHNFAAQLVTASLMSLDPHMHANVELEVPPAGTSGPVITSLYVQALCNAGYTISTIPGRPTASTEPCADINIAVDVLNFTIVADKIGQAAAQGEGHYIYYFNVTPPTTPGEPALTAEGTYVATGDSVLTWLGITPGEYTFWVQVVNNDNTPLETPLVARATIIVPVDAGRYGS